MSKHCYVTNYFIKLVAIYTFIYQITLVTMMILTLPLMIYEMLMVSHKKM